VWGTCTIRARQDSNVFYQPAEATVSFAIGRAKPAVSPWNTRKGLLGLAPTTFSASVYRTERPYGVPGQVAGGTVTFSVAGKPMCSATTDGSGVATCKASIGLANWLNEKSFTASFAGSTYYEPATATGSFG
jgi:hypothetical protein